jgi:tetratricopeptide (TPR) repeat protein
MARFFARRDGTLGSQAAAEEALRVASEEVGSARAMGDDDAVARIEAEWRWRFVNILRLDPEAAAELRDLTDELGPRWSLTGGISYGTASRGAQIHGGIAFRIPPPVVGGTLARPRQVPLLVSPFVNRLSELRALDDWAASKDTGPVKIAVLCGHPGVGKTATASRWAHLARERFPDGQLYVDLASPNNRLGEGDVSEAVALCLRALGVSDQYVPGTLAERTALFRSVTVARRLLVVLDDVSHSAQVRPLVPTGPGSAVLVTSRHRLAELAMDGAVLLPLKPLDIRCGLELLAELCGREAVAADRPAAERVAELCGGLPVALQAAAHWLLLNRGASMASLATALENEHRHLRSAALPPLEHSLSTALTTAYQQLDPDVARFYRLLGQLPGRTFDEGTATVAADLGAPRTRRLLTALKDAGLLLLQNDGRYRLHDLVRVHAWERAVAEEAETQEVALVERVTTHYLFLTAAADRALFAGRLRISDLAGLLSRVPNPFAAADAATPLEWLDAERANILAVLRAAVRCQLHTLAWQLAEAFTVLFPRRQHLSTWTESLELGVEAASAAVVPAAEARLRSMLSRPLTELGERERALAELRAAAVLAEATGNLRLIASVQEHLGRYGDRFDGELAVTAYERCVQLNERAGHRWGAAVAQYFLGRAHDARGAHSQALDTLRQAHTELTSLGATRAAARALAAIGVVHDHLREPAIAIHALRAAADLLREQGAAYDEAQTLVALAGIAERTENMEQAPIRAWRARAAEIHEAVGAPPTVARPKPADRSTHLQWAADES